MRFGHSTVGRFFQVLDQRTSLGDHFGDADLVYENGKQLSYPVTRCMLHFSI